MFLIHPPNRIFSPLLFPLLFTPRQTKCCSVLLKGSPHGDMKMTNPFPFPKRRGLQPQAHAFTNQQNECIYRETFFPLKGFYFLHRAYKSEHRNKLGINTSYAEMLLVCPFSWFMSHLNLNRRRLVVLWGRPRKKTKKKKKRCICCF